MSEQIMKAVKRVGMGFPMVIALDQNYDIKSDEDMARRGCGIGSAWVGVDLGITTTKARIELEKLVKSGHLLKCAKTSGGMNSYWPVGFLKELQDKNKDNES